jgi:hypothetical protein
VLSAAIQLACLQEKNEEDKVTMQIHACLPTYLALIFPYAHTDPDSLTSFADTT